MEWINNHHESVSALISVCGALISLSAAFVAYTFGKRKERRDQFDMQLRYFDNLRKWADLAADALTEAIHLCDLHPMKVSGESFYDRRHRLMITLSNSIDKGRWFFPNIIVDDHGAHKPIVSQGYRDKILDGIVYAYRALNRLDYTRPEPNVRVREEIVNAKKAFVGAIQQILDPAGQREEFGRLALRRRPSHRA